MSLYTANDDQNPALMFQELDLIAKMQKDAREDLHRVRTNSTSSTTSERPSVPERIIVTEDGVVRAIETFGSAKEEGEERGRKRSNSNRLRYYAAFGERPVID